MRFPTLGFGLTCVAACGSSGSSGPKISAAEPPAPPIAAQVPVDAAVDAPPPPPKLVCDDGAVPTPAPAPDPTWYCTRADGTRHGPFVTLFPDGSIEIRGVYVDGLLEGPWVRHHAATGAIVERGTYFAGQKHGTWVQASSRGGTLGRYEMVAGTGVVKQWYDDGPLYGESSYRAGVRHGPRTVYARDGAVIESARYTSGRLDGAHVFGTRDTMRFEETFAKGIHRGKRKIWLQRVLVADEKYDRRGRLDGRYTSWRTTRAKRVEGAYVAGRRHGPWVWLDRAGKKQREGGYVRGRRDGEWFEWLDEKLVWSGTYLNGRPHGTFAYLTRSGSELGHYEMTNGTGWMVTFHGNRKPATRQRMVGGVEHGRYQELTRDGKKLVEGSYRRGKKHGVWKEWTADGVLRLEQHWKEGRLDGLVRKYVDGKLATEASYVAGRAEGTYVEYRLGKPAVTGQFAHDLRTGEWTHYDASGAVVRIATYADGVLEGPYRELLGGIVVAGEMVAGRRTGTWTRTDKAGDVTTLVYRAP